MNRNRLSHGHSRVDGQLDRLLEFAIISLLRTRRPLATLDVSEAAVAVGGDAWSAARDFRPFGCPRESASTSGRSAWLIVSL